MTAILASFVRVKTLADGTPRIELDLNCKLADLAALGCSPGDQFGIARVTNDAAQAHTQFNDEEKEPLGPLAKWCVMRCKDQDFRDFLCLTLEGNKFGTGLTESGAKDLILDHIGIQSRKELDTNEAAREKFNRLIRVPFQQWQG